MIAMAMVCRPALLIADEPTTALDVTTQATVLDLIRRLQEETGMSVILVTHDLGVVANAADTVAVLRKGRLVESGPTATVIHDARHGYTRKLVEATPHGAVPEPSPRAARDPIVWMRNVSKTYPGRSLGYGRVAPPVKAVATRS
jgi:peptide/nickel transport system ATP-binding protein